jgi:hypothetical protein
MDGVVFECEDQLTILFVCFSNSSSLDITSQWQRTLKTRRKGGGDDVAIYETSKLKKSGNMSVFEDDVATETMSKKKNRKTFDDDVDDGLEKSYDRSKSYERRFYLKILTMDVRDFDLITMWNLLGTLETCLTIALVLDPQKIYDENDVLNQKYVRNMNAVSKTLACVRGDDRERWSAVMRRTFAVYYNFETRNQISWQKNAKTTCDDATCDDAYRAIFGNLETCRFWFDANREDEETSEFENLILNICRRTYDDDTFVKNEKRHRRFDFDRNLLVSTTESPSHYFCNTEDENRLHSDDCCCFCCCC